VEPRWSSATTTQLHSLTAQCPSVWISLEHEKPSRIAYSDITMDFNHPTNTSSNLNPSNAVGTPLDPPGSTSELSAAVSVTSLDNGASTVPQAGPGSASSIKNGPTSYSYSEATEGLLARLNGPAASGSYIEAREHILSSIVTSDKLPALPPITNGARGRGRPKGSGKRKNGIPGTTTLSTPGSAKRGRGGGRGRGRGGGRGGKRKRADSDESELSSGDQLSDDSANDGASQGDSNENTQLPTRTKSGRNVNRPAPFVPVISSPTSHKKKRAYRRNPENAVCKACERGHSPMNNAIVFCDGCGSAYHQYCHNPPIEKDVVQIAEKEWFCLACVKDQPGTAAPPGPEVMYTGQNLSAEQVRHRDLQIYLERPRI
jgi:PHD-finger